MKITVIGTGYVGLVSGACFAKLGHDVICVDKDKDKITNLKKGIIPIYEPGLKDLVFTTVAKNKLSFTADLKLALAKTEIVIIAVGTPTDDKTGDADLSYVFAAVKEIAILLKKKIVFLVKSTVPVGTNAKIKKIVTELRPDLKCSFVSNPEFLREGSAIKDFMEPDRVLIGVESNKDKKTMLDLYKKLAQKKYPILFTDIASAELTKYAANAFLAMKTSFVNEIANICDAVKANIEDVVLGIGMDQRIGLKHMKPGPGYGGSCFPKDNLALVGIAKRVGARSSIVETVIKSNELHKLKMAEKINKVFKQELKNKKIAILGLTFKANTDDMRYAASLTIIPKLLEYGAILNLYDPEGMKEAQKYLSLPDNKKQMSFTNSLEVAIKDVDAVVILTEWAEFTKITPLKLKKNMAGKIIFDFRNILESKLFKKAGFEYFGIGRR